MSKDPTVDFSALRRKGRLPPPPNDASNNLTAPEHAPPEAPPPLASAAKPAPEGEGEAAVITALPRPAARGRVVQPYTPPEPLPEQMDGRSRLRTGRTEPFSTRVRPDFRSRLILLANQKQCTMAEALELAVEALERELGIQSK